jgi:hypothetical protein
MSDVQLLDTGEMDQEIFAASSRQPIHVELEPTA